MVATDRHWGARFVRSVCLTGALLAAATAAAQTRIADLQRYHAAMLALEDLDDVSPQQRYRAGLFDGLLDGTLESLAMRGEACLPSCRCDVRAAVTRRLMAEAPAADALALPWLAAALKAEFPCPSVERRP